MPERVTNNAVTQAIVNGETFVYSFSGIDSTKACGHAHLRSYKYNIETDVWSQLSDLPDPIGGVVAAGASTIKNKIYIVGGYHIRDNCSEVSSNAVHMFDPATETYTKLANIPIAIDDHVQAVYNDSLLYVITGWSNSTNVTQVQIYDPSNDSWQMGTPVLNDPNWRVFGGSGSIIDNQIIYAGGASLLCNNNTCFAPTDLMRKGEIDPNDPTSISWSELNVESGIGIGYRMAATTSGPRHTWIGGSSLTYNFDGIDYNGTGGVEPNNQVLSWSLTQHLTNGTYPGPPIMDLRGIGKIDETTFITAGGMTENQEVSNKVYLVKIGNLLSSEDIEVPQIVISPNPCQESINLPSEYIGLEYKIFTIEGRLLKEGTINEDINITSLPQGQHIFSVIKDSKVLNAQSIIKIQ